METWKEVVSQALLGTGRAGTKLMPQSASGKLQETLARISATDREKALLDAAAVVSIHRRCGQKAGALGGVPGDPSPADSAQVCGPRAAHCLDQLLDNKNGGALQEFLEALARRKMRVPPVLLPRLLDAGANKRALRAGIDAVLGERGRWLAKQNPEWKYVTPSIAGADESIWETGTAAERAVFLRELRQTNPARSRELLLQVWTKERAEQREEFIAAFDANLSAEDEPFLESALSDRSTQVQKRVCALLALLPDSKFVTRMRDRVLPLARVTGSGEKRALLLEFPAQFEKSWEQDGVQEKAPQGVGQKAFWLSQMIPSISPDEWSKSLRLSPGELVNAAHNGETGDLLIDGWAAACITFRKPDWAQALLFGSPQLRITQGESLWSLLPAEKAEALLTEWLQKPVQAESEKPKSKKGEIDPLSELDNLQHAWSSEFTLVVAHALAARALKKDGYFSCTRMVGFRMNPNTADSVAAAFDPLLKQELKSDYGKRSAEELIGCLMFRREMLHFIESGQ